MIATITYPGTVTLFGRNGNSTSAVSVVVVSQFTGWMSGQAWTYLNSNTNLAWELCSAVEYFRLNGMLMGFTSLQCEFRHTHSVPVKAEATTSRDCARDLPYNFEVKSRHTTFTANKRHYSTETFHTVTLYCG